MAKEKTYKEKILAAKPGGKPKVYSLDNINPFSFRQTALRVNENLRAAKIPLPEGRTTYYEVNLFSKEKKITVTNHMGK